MTGKKMINNLRGDDYQVDLEAGKNSNCNQKRKGRVAKINIGEQDEMEISGFVLSYPRMFLSFNLIILTCGLALVLITWKKTIKMQCLYRQVPLEDADKLLLTDNFHQIFEETLVRRNNGVSFFVNKKIKYIWDQTIKSFSKLRNIDVSMNQADFFKMAEGIDQMGVADRVQEYGENQIRISVPPILYLVFHEALNPFYMFQGYTVLLWSLQYYWKFAVIIAITSVLSVTASVWETRRQNRNLRDKMKSESKVRVIRNSKEVVLSSIDLVPGDVILLPTSGGYNVEVDAVLVDGSCVVNESMLTGESIPVTKVSIPDEPTVKFNYDHHRQNVMFCGTQVLQGKVNKGNYVKAVVIRTGFMTTKGELVRAILFPPPLDFKFYSDFLKSVYVFLGLGLIGMAYSLTMWIKNGGTVAECLLNSLDILTFVVPPILPAALTANNAFAQRRLQNRGIYCLHTKHITLCGGIDVVAFDKTGTLTEGDLDLAGVCETKAGQFQENVKEPINLGHDSLLVQTMASCHSLCKIDGQLTGYPMDIKLFEAIEWELMEQPQAGVNPDYDIPTPTLVSPPKNNKSGGPLRFAPSNLEIALLKQYPFDSAVQRMTVVAKRKGAYNFNVFIKGAPEKVASLCRPETVPQEFSNMLHWYTSQGFRVIAAATKQLQPGLQWLAVDDLSRAELEEKSDFLGLIIMQNLVKKETYGAIKELHDADINTVMVTGDNILTAISVARDCELVRQDQTIIKIEAEELQGSAMQPLNITYSLPESDTASIIKETTKLNSISENYAFACDGKTFNLIRSKDPELFKRVVHRGKVFARMLPEQKIELITQLKDLGRQVIMCGDGCNDCGALKTAHAGISLSLAEASVAAPFTSVNVNIACVPYLIREGRATMVSAFASFKFGVVFCFTQLISVLLVFYIGTEPSDNQYLVVDIGLAAVPIVLIGNTAPHSSLAKRKPTRHLLSFLPMFSICSYLFFQTMAYIFIWFYVQAQEWFVEYQFVPNLWPPNSSYEQTNVYLYACAAAVIGAVIFSKGAPYRKPLYTNGIMATWTVAATATVIFMALYSSEDFSKRLNFKIAPHFEFQIIGVIGMFINFLFCYVWEIYFLDGFIFLKVLPWYKKNIRGPNLAFEHLEQELSNSSVWPPMCKNNQTEMDMGSTRKYPGYPLPDVAAGVNSSPNQFPTKPDQHVSRRDKFQTQKEVARNIRNRLSGGGSSLEEASELLSEAYDNPESTPVHLNPASQERDSKERDTAVSESINKLIREELDPPSYQESKMLSDPFSTSPDRRETAC